MKLLQRKERYLPILYPQFDEAHKAVMQSSWSPYEVSMAADLKDWSQISNKEKEIIGGLLKGFTLIEASVGCYWRRIVAETFGHLEIINMATAFSAQESIHLLAYQHLEASLNLDTYEAFRTDPISSKKLDNIINNLNQTNLATSLAVFSAFCEGVSLFSSFAVLLSFAQGGRFKGLAQILSWSIADENLHSLMGIELYKQLIKEYPEQTPKTSDIIMGCDAIVNNEIAFIKNVFKGGSLQHINEAEAIDFIKYRANKKLMELSIAPQYKLTDDYKKIKHFFDTTRSVTLNDFFARSRNGLAYSAALTQDFSASLERAYSFGF